MIEELGIKPRRFAGSSAGGLMACLVAVGYTADELAKLTEMNMRDLLVGK